MIRNAIIACASSLALGLSACSTLSSTKTNDYNYADYISKSRHEKLATEMLRENNYRGSLQHYYILNALDPKDPRYINRIRMVKAIADRHARIELQKGVQAAEQGLEQQAKTHFLKTLNIQPENQTALKRLRSLNTEEVKRVQAAHLQKVKRSMVQLADSEQ